MEELFWPGGSGERPAGAAASGLLIVRLTEAQGWLRWHPAPVPLLRTYRETAGGVWRTELYEADVCDCRPADASAAKAVVPAWQDEAEQEAVPRSAIRQYRWLFGEWPDQAAQLAQDYPRNVLSGVTPWMEENFPQVLKRVKGTADPASSPVDGQGDTGNTAPETDGGDWLPEPLAIVVDKDRHRLALVSGRVILREYPVGLGGPRTPEGEFEITEKVINPNGTPDGEFGSRGMTLGDTRYAIHGTDEPESIGKDRSLGCVRMRKEDVEELFALTPLGTRVTIGRGLLPAEGTNRRHGYAVPAQAMEENPGKRYDWLT